MKIKTLPETFKKFGSINTQVQRQGDVAIFSLQYTPGQTIGFDVILVQSYSPDYESGFLNHGDSEKWDLIETYPAPERFGSQGWSFTSLEAAEAKFQELLNNAK